MCSPVEKIDEYGIGVTASAALAVPAQFALPALETILHEFSQGPGRASLALNMRQLHLPFEATISVPIQALLFPCDAQNEWRLRIHAARRPALYPTFEGLLTLRAAADSWSELHLEGRYVVPLGAMGRVIDLTLLSGAARSSLERFMREIAYRVVAIARWIS